MKIELKKFAELDVNTLYEIMKLRQDVFVLEQTCLYPDLDDADRDCFHVYSVEDSGDISGYLRILPAGKTFDTVAIGRVLVKMEYRRRGIAGEIMNAALDYVQNEMGEKTVKLSAQQYLIKFYESLGFRIISEGYLDDGIPHIDMQRDFH